MVGTDVRHLASKYMFDVILDKDAVLVFCTIDGNRQRTNVSAMNEG